MLVEAIGQYISNRAFLYQLATTLVIYNLIKIIRFYIIRNRRYQLLKYYGIQGPTPWLFDGNVTYYYKHNRLFDVDMEMLEKYGPTWSAFYGDVPSITTTDPVILKRVFVEDSETFSERTCPFMDVNIAYSLLFCPRPRWKFFRKILSVPFSKFTSRGGSSIEFIEDSVRLMIKYIDEKLEVARLENKRADINMYDLIKSNALYMISELALKLPVEVREKEPHVVGLDRWLHMADGLFFRLTFVIPSMLGLLSFLSNHVQMNTIMTKIYDNLNNRFKLVVKKLDQENKSGASSITMPDNEHILDMLIRLEHRNQINRKELLGNAEAMMIAGYDTTSTTLTYTIWALAKYSEIQERLYQDLLMDGSNSRYLDQVLNESMRLYPVVISFVTRIATKSTQINDLVIPEGTLVFYNTYIMHRDPTYWCEPSKFNPDRFREGQEIDPIYFAPFGLGERRCLGYKLALLEMKIVLSELILRYKMILHSPQELEMETCGFNLSKPKGNISIELVKRTIGYK